MQPTTCVLTLIFFLSVRGAQVAKARVRFSQVSYTVFEAPEICVDLINDVPISKKFTMDFTYSGKLLGLENTAASRGSSAFFLEGQTMSRACISGRRVDDIPCQQDIVGTISLNNNTNLVDVIAISPATATITIKDDDAIMATFHQKSYIISEGDVAKTLAPFVETSNSAAVKLINISGNDYSTEKLSRSLNVTSLLNLPVQSLPLSEVLLDDRIALEDAEFVLLELMVNAPQNCRRDFSPNNTTTIIVSDDDNVDVNITRHNVRTREGEDYRLCVSASKMIAREIVLVMEITPGTADLMDIGQTSHTFEITLGAYDYDMTVCTDLPVVQDNIVEPDESFTVRILRTNSKIPAGVLSHLKLNTEAAVITIQDTSTCIEHTVDPSANESMLYVMGNRTLCFSCLSCQPSQQLSWTVTSFEGNIWTGSTGGRLHSRHNFTDQGVVYENGTLLITNSSTLFSKTRPGDISYILGEGTSSSTFYRIILGDEARVISLDISLEGNSSYRLVCKFTGNPQPTVEWLLSDTAIDTKGRVEMTPKDGYFISTLTLKDIKTTKYMCKVFNVFGEDYSDGTILVGATTHNSNNNLMASYSIVLLSVLLLFFM